MKKYLIKIGVLILASTLLLSAFSINKNKGKDKKDKMEQNKKTEIATFGGGCFWCVEAIYEKLDGVISVTAGYSGGDVKNPTYEEVCSGETGHAEAAQILFDPDKITYKDLLEIFWKTHDPTTLNRQGNDTGTQYRSVIFYEDEKQKGIAEVYKSKLDDSGIFNNPIVTEIVPLEHFYEAENYHQNYYEQNKSQPYCQLVITPKLEKFKKIFGNKFKKEKK